VEGDLVDVSEPEVVQAVGSQVLGWIDRRVVVNVSVRVD
jgi:hypothetical protein